MKTQHFITLSSFLFAIIFLISACVEDEVVKPNGYHFINASHELSQGLIESQGANPNGSFKFKVLLVSDDITLDSLNNPIGPGSSILLFLDSGSSTGLEEGQYDFVSQGPFTLSWGSIDLPDGVGSRFDVRGGTVDVELSGDETLLTFELIIVNGRRVPGAFCGVLQPI